MLHATFLFHAISTFKDIFDEISSLDNNAERGKINQVLGGSLALAIHGLDIGRVPDDVDYIIYDPTQKQIEYIREIPGILNANGQNPRLLGMAAMRDLRSFKLERNGVILNILLEHYISVPELLLVIHYDDRIYRVQSINNVIAAKNSYSMREEVKGGTGNRYVRQKDVYDFQVLKNLNFNIPIPPTPVKDRSTTSDYFGVNNTSEPEIDPEG